MAKYIQSDHYIATYSILNTVRCISLACCLCVFFSTYRFEEIIKRNNVEYHAGGSTQNSVKIAQVSLAGPTAARLNVF